jgi:hypothetical protein
MNRIYIGLSLLFSTAISYAGQGTATPYFESGIADRLSVFGQLDSRGTTRFALMSNVIRCGDLDGQTLVHLQVGATWDVGANPTGDQGAVPTLGVFFRMNPYLKNYVSKLPKDWAFLRSIEHGVSFNYDFHEHIGYMGYNVGFVFNPNAIQQ